MNIKDKKTQYFFPIFLKSFLIIQTVTSGL